MTSQENQNTTTFHSSSPSQSPLSILINKFKELDIVFNENIYEKNQTEELWINLTKYLNELDELQLKALLIAKNHLGTTFNLLRSNGYKEWLSEQNKNKS
jgi:hypothetical protein